MFHWMPLTMGPKQARYVSLTSTVSMRPEMPQRVRPIQTVPMRPGRSHQTSPNSGLSIVPEKSQGLSATSTSSMPQDVPLRGDNVSMKKELPRETQISRHQETKDVEFMKDNVGAEETTADEENYKDHILLQGDEIASLESNRSPFNRSKSIEGVIRRDYMVCKRHSRPSSLSLSNTEDGYDGGMWDYDSARRFSKANQRDCQKNSGSLKCDSAKLLHPTEEVVKGELSFIDGKKPKSSPDAHKYYTANETDRINRFKIPSQFINLSDDRNLAEAGRTDWNEVEKQDVFDDVVESHSLHMPSDEQELLSGAHPSLIIPDSSELDRSRRKDGLVESESASISSGRDENSLSYSVSNSESSSFSDVPFSCNKHAWAGQEEVTPLGSQEPNEMLNNKSSTVNAKATSLPIITSDDEKSDDYDAASVPINFPRTVKSASQFKSSSHSATTSKGSDFKTISSWKERPPPVKFHEGKIRPEFTVKPQPSSHHVSVKLDSETHQEEGGSDERQPEVNIKTDDIKDKIHISVPIETRKANVEQTDDEEKDRDSWQEHGQDSDSSGDFTGGEEILPI